jgi:hypothetical protein
LQARCTLTTVGSLLFGEFGLLALFLIELFFFLLNSDFFPCGKQRGGPRGGVTNAG